MSDEAEAVLKMRLVRGEISIEDFERLRAILVSAGTDGDVRVRQDREVGTLVASVDDLVVLEQAICYQGRYLDFDLVHSVRGGREKSTFNGVTSSRRTHLEITVADGTRIAIAEGGTWRHGKRHDAIFETLQHVRHLTLRARCDRALQTLSTEGLLRLTKPELLARDPVCLYSDGSIGNSRMRFGIQHAHTSGTLVFGVSQGSYPMSTYTPDEIVISDKKAPRFLALPLSHKICFVPTDQDPDVVRALITWYAGESGN